MPKEKIVDKTEMLGPDNPILIQYFNNPPGSTAAYAI